MNSVFVICATICLCFVVTGGAIAYCFARMFDSRNKIATMQMEFEKERLRAELGMNNNG